MFFARAARFGVRRRSAAFSFLVAVRLLVRILGANSEGNAAARGKLRGQDRFARCARFDEIVKDAVCDSFVERVLVPIRCQIKFQRLTFDAETIGYVIDIDPGKVGLTCDRANGSEIIRFKMDPVIPARRRIWKSLEPRLRRRGGEFRLASPEQS